MEALVEDITLVCGVVIALGVVGTVLPVLPGALLIGGAVGVWAIVAQTAAAWWVLAAVVLLLVAGQVLKYLTAGRTMTTSGVPRRSLVVAGLLGIVGFFVLPVLGLPVGFVGGLYVAERARLGPGPGSRQSTVVALKAVGIAVLVELTSALLAGATWLVAVVNGAAG